MGDEGEDQRGYFFLRIDGDVKARKSKVRKFDSSPHNFAAEKESGFMPHFEQEIYQYVLFVGTITVIEAEFLTLEPAGGHQRPRRSVEHLQVSSNQLYLSQTL